MEDAVEERAAVVAECGAAVRVRLKFMCRPGILEWRKKEKKRIGIIFNTCWALNNNKKQPKKNDRVFRYKYREFRPALKARARVKSNNNSREEGGTVQDGREGRKKVQEKQEGTITNRRIYFFLSYPGRRLASQFLLMDDDVLVTRPPDMKSRGNLCPLRSKKP